MTFKQTFLPLVILFICQLSMAQGFRYEYASVDYILPPNTPFQTEFNSITYRVQGEEHLRRYGILTSTVVDSILQFNTYLNKEQGGDLHFDLIIGKPEYLGATAKTTEKTVDERKVLYHFYEGTVITPMTYTLRDGAREIIEEKIYYSATDHFQFTSPSFRSKRALTEDWKESQNITISKKLTGILNSNLEALAAHLKDRFDAQIKTKKITVFDIKKGDRINAEFLNEAYNIFEQEVKKNRYVATWDEAIINKMMSIYEKGYSFDRADKAKRVAFTVSHYGAGMLKTFTGDFDEAKKLLLKGTLAEKKVPSFKELLDHIEMIQQRGKGDAVSSKEYAANYVEGADAKLPGAAVAVVDNGSIKDDFTTKKGRTVDTVFTRSGDKIIGYVKILSKNKKIVGGNSIPDFTRLLINPLNKPQEEIKVDILDVLYMRHNDIYMLPMPSKMAGILSPPIHMYEIIKQSDDKKATLMRTAYHESLDYSWAAMDARGYLILKGNPEEEDTKIIALTGGSKYAMGVNNGIAGEFENCKTIVDNAEIKKYEKSEDSYIQIIDDYNQCFGTTE